MGERTTTLVRCTGLTARWCDIHGQCTCPFEDGWEDMDDPTCPLHAHDSAHPSKRIVTTVRSGGGVS